MKSKEIIMRNLYLLIVLLLLGGMLSAATMWNAPVPIRQGVNIEWFRTGCETGDGGAIYVWSDTKLTERDLWAQKVDAAGNAVWGEPILVDGKPDRQEDPVITRTSDGNYIIAWIDFCFDPDGDVYAQKINDAGELLWQEGGVPVCTLPVMQLGLNMEADNDGGAFIIWGDSRNPSKDLYAQRISSTGAPLWTLNGIPIANAEGDEIQNTMLPDGQGGMILAYVLDFVGEKNIYAKRFDANGNMVWAQPLELATAPGEQSGVRLAALSGGDFVFTWMDKRSDDPDIYAQKVNLAGQKLWPEPFVVMGEQGVAPIIPQQNPRIQATSDNAVVIVWEDFRLDYQNCDLFAQKISASGQKLWGESGVAVTTAEFAQIGQRMAKDNNGGVYIVWDDYRNGNAPNDDIYAQHLSATGEALWDEGGKAICTQPFEQNGGLVKVSGDNIFINWMDLRNGSVGIYYQVLNPAGDLLLQDDGVEVFWGLSGDAPLDQYSLHPRANDVLIVWQDTRFANEGKRIYYQIIDASGNTTFPVNGVPVTVEGGGDQENADVVITPDNGFAIVWQDSREGNPMIYAQLFNAAGERQWEPNGRKITQDYTLSQINPKISYFNDSYYIGWSEWVQYDIFLIFYRVYGQRIQDGNMLWGPNGKEISVFPSSEMANECRLHALIDDMYMWHRLDAAYEYETIWAKRVNPDGTTANGFSEKGNPMSVEGTSTSQLSPMAVRSPQGINVIWRDKRDGIRFQYYAQNMSRDGERLWADEGQILANRNREQELPALSATNYGMVYAWCESVGGMHDIATHKYGFDGSPLWGDLGYFAVQKDSTQSNPTLASFADNGVFLGWTDYSSIESDIYYNYLNSHDGMVFSPQGQVLCDAPKNQYEPKAVVLNNEAYVIWADGISSGKTEILGLYMQKVNNESVSVEDYNSPQLAKLKLKQNYPNPFNPHTNIALSMPQSGALSLKIYNAKGQLVKEVFSGDLPKGEHSFTWDGTDARGRAVASGVYFYTAKTAKGSSTRKMLLMK